MIEVGIGEWQYGVSMIPCHQALAIIEKQNKMIKDMALNIKELADLDYSVEENYIEKSKVVSKDKIKNMIEELKDVESETSKKILNSKRHYWLEVIQDVLKELLKED